MTENFTQRIKRFLDTDTNYALLIKGRNGVGKTYYIKNQLFPKVHKTVVTASIIDENYYPVLISLFGIRSVEELQEQLFLELLPLLKNKSVKTTPDIGMILTKMFCKIDIEQLINQEQLLLELSQPFKNKSIKLIPALRIFFTKMFYKNRDSSPDKGINIKKILFCFDDINRKSDALQSKELFGFINNILEDKNIKLILIENEDELAKVDVDYSQMREKVVGATLKFKTNVPLIYNQIITSKYKEKSPSYYNFLNEQSQGVISKIEKNNNNLRTLTIFLDHYEIIFTSLEAFFKHEVEVYKPFKKESLNVTFNFALSISIEFIMGKLTPNLIFGLRQAHNGMQLIQSPVDRELTQKELEDYKEIVDYTENYEEKYLYNINYKPITFFNSIFDYIVGDSLFISENLVDELKPRFIIKDTYSIFDKLFELEGLDLSMSEIENLIDEMLNLVDKGAFYLNQYPIVYAVVWQFLRTPERYKIIDLNSRVVHEKVVNRFKKGIDKWALNYNQIDYPEFNVNLEERDRPFDEKLGIGKHFYFDEGKSSLHATRFDLYGLRAPERSIDIYNYCQEVKSKILSQNEKKEINLLFELYKKDIITFTEKISEPYTKLRYYPIYSKFEFKEFWAIFKKAKNSQFVEFVFHLEQRYQPKFIRFLDSERHFISKLEKKLHAERKLEHNFLILNFDRDVILYLLVELSKITSLFNKLNDSE